MIDVALDGKTKQRLLVGSDVGGPCSGGMPGEYVQRGSNIFRVQRAPKQKSSKALVVCGCPPPRCGGAAPRLLHAGYELPANTTYAGAIEIEYETNDVYVSYSKPCPLPP